MQPFTKYQALGNDFILIHRRSEEGDVDASTVRSWCDRHLGVGADGVLSIVEELDGYTQMTVHNADGTIAEMCGNGIRCVAKHIAEKAEAPPETVHIQTGAGLVSCTLHWGQCAVQEVTVDLGPARLVDRNLPAGGPFVEQKMGNHLATAVSLGNPHLVLLNSQLAFAETYGAELVRHHLFPEGTNVEFVEKTPSGGLKVVVWERGVGRTLACGTGACAAVVAEGLSNPDFLDRWISVELPGGHLAAKVSRDLSHVWLRGPVARVFVGHIE